MTAINTRDIPTFSRAEARILATTEYQRLADLLARLADSDWAQPTDCPPWDVRDMAGHCLGMQSDFTSLPRVLRRLVAATRDAKRRGGPMIDSMTAMQVSEYGDLGSDEMITQLRVRGPRAAIWRTSRPALLRALPMTETVGGEPETWRLGYLLDTILTRDTWMHRIDIARATGREFVQSAEHDGRIVAEIVAEWGRRHGLPFQLTLTGPAGGDFVAGAAPVEELTVDAVEFCRILSGRAPGTGLLAHQVPF